VRNSIISSTLFEGRECFVEFAIESIYNFKNCSKEELYIQFTKESSIMVKYNVEPLMATGLYCSLFSLISLDFTSDSSSLIATSFAYYFVTLSTSISSVSSSKFPLELISLSRRFLSSSYKSFLFLFTSNNRLFRDSSKAFYSTEITFPNNYYSRPVCVTVKSIIVILADNSGEKVGIARRQVIYILKCWLYSIVVPPTSMNLFFPFVCTYFSRIGSIIGSTSLLIPSMIIVLPSSIQNFK